MVMCSLSECPLGLGLSSLRNSPEVYDKSKLSIILLFESPVSRCFTSLVVKVVSTHRNVISEMR